MNAFKNKVVVITGAGSGIGRALAEAFACDGAKLALNDYQPTTLNDTVAVCQQKGVTVFAKSFDVSNRDEMKTFAVDVVQYFGGVDVVINNAGIGLGDYLFHEMDLAHFERVMQINFFGVLYGSHAFIPYLLKQQEAALVNISSIFGLTGIAKSSAYCASKFAVHGLNQCLVQEYKGTGLQIHSVHPGGINTNIGKNSLDYTANASHDEFQKQFLKISPDDAAQIIISGIRKNKRKILIGGEAHQLDFATRLMPQWGGDIVNKIIRQKMKDIAKQPPQ